MGRLTRPIQVSPSVIELKVGEYKQLQVLTTAKSYKLKMEPKDVVEYDNINQELLGLKPGYCNLTFIVSVHDEHGKETTYKESTVVQVEADDSDKTPTRIMLHNRHTNRLVTLVSDAVLSDDISFKLPSKDGKLLTDSSFEDSVSAIRKPSIINTPAGKSNNFKKELESSPFMIDAGITNENHIKSTWQFSRSRDMTEIIREVVHETGDLRKCGHELFGVELFVRVKYNSENYESAWSDPVRIYATAETPAENLRVPLAGKDNYSGIWYGKIEKQDLVDDYDYRGTYNTLFKHDLKDFKANQQVEHEGKLWYAKTALTPTTVVTPGTDSGKWVEDTRENLPTFRLLLDMIGIGVGLEDNNLDGYSSGATGVGPMTGVDGHWLKFIYKGKVIYTPSKTLCRQICWNDIAKREAVYGDRTIRYGSRLYKVRLMTEGEYKHLLIGLAKDNQDLHVEVQLDPNTWIEDFQEGPARKVMGGDLNVGTLDPKSRTGCYRPVLELIATGSEPYRHWGLGALADNERFQYDKFTDTGYFGEVPADRLITGDALSAHVGLTVGTSKNNNTNWLKFYWHGMVIYMPKNGLRYNMNWNELKQVWVTNGYCMGSSDYRTVTVNKKEYVISLPIGARAQPYDLTNFNTTDATTYTKTNIDADLSKYSMWQELVYRVQKGYVDAGTSDTSHWGYNNFKNRHGGVQKGDNWAEFDPKTEMILTGNGAATGPHAREITASNNAAGHCAVMAQTTAGGWWTEALTFKDNDSSFSPILKLRADSRAGKQKKNE